MPDSLTPYLPFVLPPLLGAIIGYVTNYIAIRMLFRPLHPWHILGIRVPMTPGIIPSRRGDLARKMGQMVGEHLVTSKDVGRALDKEEFRQHLYQALELKLDKFIQRPIGAPITLVPRRLHQRCAEILELLRFKLEHKLSHVLHSATFAERVEQFCADAIRRMLERELDDFLDEQEYQRLRIQLETGVRQWLENPATRHELEHWCGTIFERCLESNKTLHDLLPDQVMEQIRRKLQEQITPLGTELIAAMRAGENRAQLEHMARTAVDALIDSVEGLSALVGALFDMNIIYARLPEFIDKALDGLDEWLHTPAAQQSIAAVIDEHLNQWATMPVSAWMKNLNYAEVRAIKQHICTAAYQAITSEAVRTQALELLDAMFERNRHRTLKELGAPLLGDAVSDNGNYVSARISTHVLAYLRSEEFSRRSSSWLEHQASHIFYTRPVGTLSAYLPSDARDELYHGLMRLFIVLLKKELPPMVESLNVSRIVEDKVNQLDIMEVENLLMGIMREQFRYINLFGALLGFLIGLLNLALLHL